MKIAVSTTMGFVAALTLAPRAFAEDPLLPVVISSVGPKAVRLRVAAGLVLPCSSSSNAQLFDGTIGGGQEVALRTKESCICVEHTFDDFPDKNWSSPEIACRPVICTGFGRGRVCRPNPDQTIRVAISSTAP